MARRIEFKEFKKAVDSRMLDLETLGDYVEFDEASPVPMLRFREDALIDAVPEGYDVDEEIYRMLRDIDDEQEAQAEKFSFVSKERIVAEGDSWYNLPPIVRPSAIADWIKKNRRYRVKNIAKWGHTLKEILDQAEYLDAIKGYDADFFMLGGGGNDLQEGLAKRGYFHPYGSERPIDDYLTDDGKAGLSEIESGLTRIITEVHAHFPNLPVLVHGYDYPRPLVGNGKYIGRYLRELGFPDHKMESAIEAVIDVLNQHVESAAAQSPMAHYIDCRSLTQDYTWYDDMHPASDGFLELSLRFEDEMNTLSQA